MSSIRPKRSEVEDRGGRADKDFGELVFRQRLLHSGIVLIRLAGLEPETKAELVLTAFAQHADDWGLGFAVLSRRALRLRKRPL